jgi:hypothetical protein
MIPGSSLRRLAVAGFALLLAACGEAGLMDGVGGRSQDAVLGDLSTTTTVIVETDSAGDVPAIQASDVVWYNDRIELQYQGDASYVIQKVWQRREGESRFVQASRLEIAEALPDIRFPGLVPGAVGWITSQLVYDTTAATLDTDTAAAFGLWSVEPYTVSDGQLAVLRVGVATEDERVAAFEIVPDVVDDGLSLQWVTGRFRYELFCRVGLPEDLCWQMAETNRLLTGQLGSEDAAVTS